MMKKLAIFINSMDGGGAERVTTILIEELKSSFEIHLILLEENIVYQIPEEIQVHILLKKGLPDKNLLKISFFPFFAYKYYVLCKKLKIDISFSLLDIPNWINCLLKKLGWRTKVVISQRNYVSDYINNFNPAVKILYKTLIKSLFNHSDLIIPNARAMATDLIENYGVNSEKVKTIYNPLNLEDIQHRMRHAEEIVLDTERINCLNMARLNYRKNQKIIIDALGILKTEDIVVHFLGKGMEEQNLRIRSQELNIANRVLFHGFQKEPISYLQAVDIFILSSNNEGFPNVLLEALACKKVIISTNCNSGPLELLSPENLNPTFNQDGYAICTFGILVAVNNAQALSKAIEYAMNNLVELKSRIENERTDNYVLSFDKKVISLEFKNELLGLVS